MKTTTSKSRYFLIQRREELSLKKVRVWIEKELKLSDITATDLQDEKLGPIIIEEFRKKFHLE